MSLDFLRRVLLVCSDTLSFDAMHSALLAAGVPAASVIRAPHVERATAVLNESQVDLALLASRTADEEGLDYIPDVINLGRARRIMIFGERIDCRTLRAIRRLGFSGCIDMAKADISELRSAIVRVAMDGAQYLGPGMADAFRQAMRLCSWDCLSKREEFFLSLVGAGYDNEEIAEMVGVSPGTVRGHRTRIMGKLNLQHKGRVMQFALFHNFVRFTERGVLHPGFQRELQTLRRNDVSSAARLRLS